MILAASLLELAAAAARGASPILDLHATDPCARATGEEIVVCGSRDRQSRYQLPALPKIYDRTPLRAETDIGGTHARAHVQSQVRPDGFVDKRIMITFSVPF